MSIECLTNSAMFLFLKIFKTSKLCLIDLSLIRTGNFYDSSMMKIEKKELFGSGLGFFFVENTWLIRVCRGRADKMADHEICTLSTVAFTCFLGAILLLT